MRFSLCCTILLASVSVAQANDSVFGGSGTDLVPMRETRARMAAEDIVIEEFVAKNDNRRWRVKATYTFENPTDETLDVTMGFPEAYCPEEMECLSPDHKHLFADFKTTVDGKPVKTRTGSVSRADADWAPELGRVHLFDVKLKPKSKTTVVHTYHHGWSGTAGGPNTLSYITRTGALWNGPIGQARFTIRMRERPWSLVYPNTYTLTHYASRPEDKRTTEIVFEQTNWTPTQNLELSFGTALSTSFGPCPQADSAALQADLAEPTLAHAQLDFGDLNDADLRLCRNLPFAHHGYVFNDQALNERFYTAPEPVSGFFDDDDEPKTFIRVGFRRNPNFDASTLSAEERGYIKLVQQLEAARAQKPARK